MAIYSYSDTNGYGHARARESDPVAYPDADSHTDAGAIRFADTRGDIDPYAYTGPDRNPGTFSRGHQ